MSKQRNTPYDFDEVVAWHSSYIKCGSITATSKMLNVDRGTISKYFKIFGERIGIVLKGERGDQRYCSCCKSILDNTKFAKNTRSKCRQCYYAQQKEWVARNRARYNRCALEGRRRRINCTAITVGGEKRRCSTCFQLFNKSDFYKRFRKGRPNVQYGTVCSGCRPAVRKSSINSLLASGLRSRIRHALIGKRKVGSAVDDLGCSLHELELHLESKFHTRSSTGEVMSWGNYGYRGWHIDHVVPLSAFDLSDRESFAAACHYTNLQPLWAEDNFRKGNKIL